MIISKRTIIIAGAFTFAAGVISFSKGIITFVTSFATTLVFEYIVATPKLDGAFMLEVKIALGNAIYATLVYFITSFVWCNWLPTNAYRLLKF